MKKLILLLITLTTLITVSYASFPVSENIKSEVLTSTDSEDPDWIENLFGVNFDNGKSPPLNVFILPWLIPLLLFYLIRGYKRDVPWIKKLLRWKNIWYLLLLIPIFLILGLLMSGGVSGL